MMIIIVEGMDNAGKTTLAQYLAKQLKAVYIKVERPQRAIDLLAYQNILEVANAYSGFVVTDRHVAISEPIYGPICRGGHDLKVADIDLCYDRFQAVIYCRPPAARIMATIYERQQMQGVSDNAERLIAAYDEWWRELRTRKDARFTLMELYDFTTTPRRVDLLDCLLTFRKEHGL